MKDETAVLNAIDTVFGRKKDRFRSVKDFLYRVQEAGRKISLIESRIEYRRDSIGAHGIRYGEYIRGGQGYGGSSVEKSAVGLAQLEEKLQQAKREYSEAMERVSELIAKLEDVHQQTVMKRRYIAGQDWEKIGLDMDISIRDVRKIHGQALPILAGLLEGKAAA